MKTKQSSLLAIVLLFHFLFLLFLQNALSPIHFDPKKIFAADMLGIDLYMPKWLLPILDLGNIILLWLISKKFFNKNALIVPIIYSISPWSNYLVFAGSFYIYLLFVLLNAIYGLLMLKSKKSLGTILLSVSLLILAYSSLPIFFIVPFVFLIPLLKVISLRDLKSSFVVIVIFILPLLFLIGGHFVGFKNILNNEVKVFSDPGLLNMVNKYQGSAQQEGLDGIAKISENKYLFTLEKVLLKYSKQLALPNYFTSQEKLLNFSFTPPIFLGFLIPFGYGLYLLIKKPLRKVIFFSSILVIPSVFSGFAVDLNRLIIFAPVLMIIISYGFLELIKIRKKKAAYILLCLTLFLVVFQFISTLFDIQLREKARFTKYYEFEKNYEIGKQ